MIGAGEPGTGSLEPGPAWDDLILVGVVARTHGNKGEVIVNPHTDFVEERFRPGAAFQTRLASGERLVVEVSRARVHQGRPVIGFTGVGSISEAERFTNAELRMPASEQAALPAGHYYHHELIGCAVVAGDGELVGRVVGVEGEMGTSRLVVEGPRRRFEVPLADEICTVDVPGRRIVVRLPDGLMEL